MLPIQCVVSFVFGPPLCGGGGDYGSFILVPLKKTWGILDSGIAVHLYRHTNVDELDYGIEVHSTAAQACSTQSQAVFNQWHHSIATSHQALFNR